MAPNHYWLLKAEPDSRVVKGKDVKFSVDDFERVGTSPWEGVRNYEARNLMKEMKSGEQALFYHSNCKIPGIAAFAKVSKEAYPDYTAWDESHPYYDPKGNSENPRWFMVDLTFVSRAKHFIPLALLRLIADSSAASIPEEVAYIGEEGVEAIKGMSLISKGRLSVQRVTPEAWQTLTEMAHKGGWDNLNLKPGKKGNIVKSDFKDVEKGRPASKRKRSQIETDDQDKDDPTTTRPRRSTRTKR